MKTTMPPIIKYQKYRNEYMDCEFNVTRAVRKLPNVKSQTPKR